MKTPKIKFTLTKLEKALVMQILEQPLVGFMPFSAKNGMEVKSSHSPEISSDIIYLRGSYTNHDFRPATFSFDSNTDRNTCYNKVIAAIKDWSENHPLFKKKSNTTPKKVEEKIELFEF